MLTPVQLAVKTVQDVSDGERRASVADVDREHMASRGLYVDN